MCRAFIVWESPRLGLVLISLRSASAHAPEDAGEREGGEDVGVDGHAVARAEALGDEGREHGERAYVYVYVDSFLFIENG